MYFQGGGLVVGAATSHCSHQMKGLKTYCNDTKCKQGLGRETNRTEKNNSVSKLSLNINLRVRIRGDLLSEGFLRRGSLFSEVRNRSHSMFLLKLPLHIRPSTFLGLMAKSVSSFAYYFLRIFVLFLILHDILYLCRQAFCERLLDGFLQHVGA